jgi:hypothetical protein
VLKPSTNDQDPKVQGSIATWEETEEEKCTPKSVYDSEEFIGFFDDFGGDDFSLLDESEDVKPKKSKKPKHDNEEGELRRKYQKAFDSLQNAMEVMEDKWQGISPTSIYYSDESEDDSSCQVSWATGMNTEIAIENGEHDWVIFKKKQARLRHVGNKLQEFLSNIKQDYSDCSPDPFENDSDPYVEYYQGYYGDEEDTNDEEQSLPTEICFAIEESDVQDETDLEDWDEFENQEISIINEVQLADDDEEWDYWLVDSGATTTVDKTSAGMEIVPTGSVKDLIKVGNGKQVKVEARGIRGLKTEDGSHLTLYNVAVVPGFTKKIISAARLAINRNRVMIGQEESYIENPSGKRIYLFKKPDNMWYLKAKSVCVRKELAMNLEATRIEDSDDEDKQNKKDENGDSNTPPKTRKQGTKRKTEEKTSNQKGQEENIKRRRIQMDVLHVLFAHASEDYIRATAKHMKIQPIGKLSPCYGCAEAKARQKNTTKEAKKPATKPGE